MAWQRPSDRVAELWRGAVERLLEAPDELLDQLDEAILAAAESAAAEDPGLVAAIRRSNRANLVHWTEANLRDPGGPVAANLGPETMVIARDLVRRGLDETVLQSYRVGQNIAWSLWMSICFEATSTRASCTSCFTPRPSRCSGSSTAQWPASPRRCGSSATS